MSLGLWLNPGRGRWGHQAVCAWGAGGHPGTRCRWGGGMQGWSEGWRHKPVQLKKSFVPWRGREQGTPVFYGREVLSFHSQRFRSVSETEERKRTTKQQTNMLHMRTRPGGPSTALGWDAGAFPWIFPSLFPPCSDHPCSLRPLPSSPTTESSPGHGAGVALPHPAGIGGFSQQ